MFCLGLAAYGIITNLSAMYQSRAGQRGLAIAMAEMRVSDIAAEDDPH